VAILDKYFSNFLVKPLKAINYIVCSSREEKQRLDPHHAGSRACARVQENAVYRYWVPTDDPHFPHELVHLYAHNLGVPYNFSVDLTNFDGSETRRDVPMVSTSLMQEGLAVALDDMLFERTIHENGRWEKLVTYVKEISDWSFLSHEMLNFDGFVNIPNQVIIPFTGYFSRFLIEKFGFEKYKQVYASQSELKTPDENAKEFYNAYGVYYADLLQGCVAEIEKLKVDVN
jgi:hypothetical protein